MALLDTSRTTFGSTSAVPSFIYSMVSTVVEWNDKRVTRNALSALSNRELEDIGLCRGDIDAVVESRLVR